MTKPNLYDPLTYHNLMAGLIVYFERQPRIRLDAVDQVAGPEIYALFYTGGFEAYRSISDTYHPIYVGKAVPPGARKGTTVDEAAPVLQRRIREHRRSIADTENLVVREFTCRSLAVVPVWITLAERFLIDYYKPVWNLSLDGFGNHDPGAGRRQGEVSWWDTLHPGRSWTRRLRQSKSTEDARRLADQFFKDTL